MAGPSRFQRGVTTVGPDKNLSSFPFPDPFHTASVGGLGVAFYSTDFMDDVSEYTITGASSTFPLGTAIAGGTGVLTPGGTTTATAAYKNGAAHQLIAGNKFWFTSRFQASAVAGNVSFYVGLRNGSSATEGIWFTKAAASTSLNLVSTVSSSATTLVTGVTTAAAATWIDVGFYYDGTDLLVYLNGSLTARVANPTIGSSGTTLTNAILTPVFQITPTATDTLTVDYVLAGGEITR